MAAKVIHFKKNGSSAPQKFVADDGGNNISAVLSSPCSAGTIFPPFYRRRAARKQYFCRFIVTVQRGNNILAVLSSPCGAGTIFLLFYRHRAAREQYFRVLSSPCGAATIFLRFIVTAQRGNNIFAFYRHRAAREQYFCVLSSPCSAGTIFLPFYRHRAARKRYFRRFSACSAPANTFPNGFGFCRPTASVQKCGENRAGMVAGLMQREK